MGANFTICCCRYYLRHNREEKSAILRWDTKLNPAFFLIKLHLMSFVITTSPFPSSSMRTSSASRQPEPASSESSDSDTNWESIFGPQPPTRSKKPSQRTTSYPLATISRAREVSIRRGSEGKLQDFINMRDQADKATEVRGKVWCWMRCREEKREETADTENAAGDLSYWHLFNATP